MEADAGLDARGVDAHVGSVIRMRRKTKGISQQRLAASLGVSFQQVQKYERGVNRVAASTLLRLAEALGCEVADFYVGLPTRYGSEKRGDPDGYGSIGRQFLSAEGGLELARAYVALASDRRRAVLSVARALQR